MSITEVILVAVVVMLFVMLFIPIVKNIAVHVGALDIPDARKVHKAPMPRMGGLGIFAGFLVGYVLFGYQSIQMNSILIGSFIIILTGIADDINPLSAKYKLIGQFVAALLIPLYGNIVFPSLSYLTFKTPELNVIW